MHRTLYLLGKDTTGQPGWVFLLRNFSVAISVSPHVCFILVFNSDYNTFMS